MPLVPGTRLGPYEVSAPLGAGGMGEVYRARDPRLGRDVAIKVLPGAIAGDADRLRRFEREARAASALNHPGILTIHDFGLHEGTPYVVSELLEGQTLRERIAATALPVRKTLDYATQLAGGLAAAHEKGIVHRDLKPDNVFVTTDGRVKILDFGLAKSNPLDSSETNLTEPASVGTEPGVILGTVGYMSPEQVRGLTADHRSDIFSFGTIVYEMATGQQAFRRGSTVETLSAILKEEPRELSEASTTIPAGLARVIGHCLEKDPGERFQSARDIAFHLGSLAHGSGTDRVDAPSISSRPRRAVWVALAAVLLAAFAGYAVGSRAVVAPSEATPVDLHRLTDFAGLEEAPALSPDGRSVAFTAYVGGRRQVFLRLVSGGAALQLTRDDADHESPRWAPDGASLIYYSPPAEGERQGDIWEVPALGGAPRRIANAIGGGDISHDATRIAFFRSEQNQVHLVTSSRDGSSARVIARLPFESVLPLASLGAR